jgi:hypothetical protein
LLKEEKYLNQINICNFTCWFVDDGSKLWANAVNIELTTSDGFCNGVNVFFES